MRFLLLFLTFAFFACGTHSDEASPLVLDATAVDAGMPDAQIICNEVTFRAESEGPFTCPAPPESVVINDRGREFEIFKYEASHPLATNLWAFPCARVQGEKFEAPAEPTEPCSRAGFVPWHSVRWDDAQSACEAINWRLCSRDELVRACQGPNGRRFTFGAEFRGGACNVRDAYRDATGASSTVAPTGAFEDCMSVEGVNDLTGNLWEWSNERDEADAATRYYHAAGWKTIAERHRDSDQACNVENRIPGFSARSFLKEYVGFRCCRNL
jgi:formylglycine-generating enzyme required for sulfatase activity